jgi:hypothetical protein
VAGDGGRPLIPRIVSLVPSLTATLLELGLGDRLVGRTVYCPSGDCDIPAVGGTKNPDLDAIRRLAPHLVLAVREENRKEDVVSLRAAGIEVEVFEPRRIDDGPPLAQTLGRLAGDPDAGEKMAEEIEDAIDSARESAPEPIPAAYLVWMDPLRVAGPDTYVADVLRTAGLTDCMPRGPERYPEVTGDDLAGSGAGVLLLPTEPWPFRKKHEEEITEAIGIPARLCRGDLVGWYPSRIPAALAHLAGVRASLP